MAYDTKKTTTRSNGIVNSSDETGSRYGGTANRYYAAIETALVASVLAIILFTYFASLVNISFGSDHGNMIRTFDGDEYYGVMIMKRNLQTNIIDPRPHLEHGKVYQAISFWAIKALISLGYTPVRRLSI